MVIIIKKNGTYKETENLWNDSLVSKLRKYLTN